MNAAEKLAALRTEMTSQSIDWFLVPHADEYFNEYQPACSERLGWLTGFYASAGACIVGKDSATLFADGRYTLQVRQQTDASLYGYKHLGDDPQDVFLAEHAKPGQVVGYDANLHTQATIDALAKTLNEKRISLRPVSHNPVDAIWKDRPAAPTAPIMPHELRYAGEISSSKREKIAAQMRKDGVDAVVLTKPEALAWLLNVRGDDVPNTPLPLSRGILYSDGRLDWFVNPAKLSVQTRDFLDADISLHDETAFLPAVQALAQQKLKIQADSQGVSAAVTRAITEYGGVLVKAADPCILPRACKNETEINGMRNAHLRDAVAVVRFLSWLETQKSSDFTEVTIAEKLLSFRAEGADFVGTSFDTIAGHGPNGAIVHYRAEPATARVLTPETILLLDSGAQYRDGTTDITRTIALGKPTAEMKRSFTLVLKGHIDLARAKFFAGTTGANLDILARAPLWAEGLNYDHGTGHGVGAFLGVHEGPQSISMRSNVALQPGMVCSNEPGYYKSGEYGIRIESLVVVREAEQASESGKPLYQFETITQVPIDRRLIDPALLTHEQLQWLDSYHAGIRAKLSPLLDAPAKKWLESATAPFLSAPPQHKPAHDLRMI